MTSIHFHRSDERFCGTSEKMRQFTFEPNEVTCQRCKDNDGFVLSPESDLYVRALNNAAT